MSSFVDPSLEQLTMACQMRPSDLVKKRQLSGESGTRYYILLHVRFTQTPMVLCNESTQQPLGTSDGILGSAFLSRIILAKCSTFVYYFDIDPVDSHV